MPRQCLISHGGQLLSVDYATDEDQSVCRNIISDSAAAGKDNVGIDEFSDELASRLDVLLITSQIFAARDTKTKTPRAFILVSPSLYGRCLIYRRSWLKRTVEHMFLEFESQSSRKQI